MKKNDNGKMCAKCESCSNAKDGFFFAAPIIYCGVIKKPLIHDEIHKDCTLDDWKDNET